MPEYKVIQWATGVVGKAALRGVIRHPQLELDLPMITGAMGTYSAAR